MTGTFKSNPPFKADHVGSLLRPRELIQAFMDYASGNLPPEAYAAFCEYTAELFAVAAAARQELNDISA